MAYKPQIGMPVQELDTPALLLDLDAFERNIQKMAAFFADKPVSLRPHSKTHKCPQIAHRQLEAGAIGITCAKVSEAEVMADAGINDILIASQVNGPVKIDRLTDLARRCDLMVAVDDSKNVAQLSQACIAEKVTLRVLLEVEIGMKRCGVQPGEAALQLARQVMEAPGLYLKGVMGYEGHLVLLDDPGQRLEQVQNAFAPLALTVDLMRSEGLPVEIVSAGGTGTFDSTGMLPFITEMQCGSYIFMDSTYNKVRSEFQSALTVLTSVVSHPVPERVVVDAGLKAMSSEFGWPQSLDEPSLSVYYLSEEHGVLDVTGPMSLDCQPGDKIRFLPSHCCTAVNLSDTLHVIQDNRLVALWPVAARGCTQ